MNANAVHDSEASDRSHAHMFRYRTRTIFAFVALIAIVLGVVRLAVIYDFNLLVDWFPVTTAFGAITLGPMLAALLGIISGRMSLGTIALSKRGFLIAIAIIVPVGGIASWQAFVTVRGEARYFERYRAAREQDRQQHTFWTAIIKLRELNADINAFNCKPPRMAVELSRWTGQSSDYSYVGDLKYATEFTYLSLANLHVMDKDVTYLYSLDNLQYLDVTDSTVSERALERLQIQLPALTILRSESQRKAQLPFEPHRKFWIPHRYR